MYVCLETSPGPMAFVMYVNEYMNTHDERLWSVESISSCADEVHTCVVCTNQNRDCILSLPLESLRIIFGMVRPAPTTSSKTAIQSSG